MAEKKPELDPDNLDDDDILSCSGKLSFDTSFTGLYGSNMYSDSDDECDGSTFGDVNVSADSIIRGYSFCDVATTRNSTISFNITDSSVITEGTDKYVVYTISVVRSPGVDTDSAIIQHRYSDFNNLHKELTKTHPAIIAKTNAKFPKKRVFRLSNSTVEERKLLLVDYLQKISSSEEIRKTDIYKEFFYMGDLREACVSLRAGNYIESYKLLLNGLHLQEKLGMDCPDEIAPTLCSIVVVCSAMDKLPEAIKYGSVALELLENDISSVYNLPLLNTLIELYWRQGKDKSDLEMRLAELQRISKQDVESVDTLRELAVGRFT